MKKFLVFVDYGGTLEYKIEAESPSEALERAEQFVMEYVPRYTIRALKNDVDN